MDTLTLKELRKKANEIKKAHRPSKMKRDELEKYIGMHSPAPSEQVEVKVEVEKEVKKKAPKPPKAAIHMSETVSEERRKANAEKMARVRAARTSKVAKASAEGKAMKEAAGMAVEGKTVVEAPKEVMKQSTVHKEEAKVKSHNLSLMAALRKLE